MESKKYVYLFKEGNAAMKNLLGGKGANLADMTNIGIPVPQGFTVTTEACNKYYEDNEVIAKEVVEQIHSNMGELERITGKKFGSLENPLLVSVRSGARASMPGMMDTILNLGLNDDTVEVLAKKTQNPRFAYDSYRRFIQMFSDVVMEIDKKHFEDIMDEIKEARGVKLDTELNADDLKELVKRFKEFYKKEKGEDFPSDPEVQLIESITAVFRSWNNPRAIVYRRLNDIPSNWGTAVNVQEMVFGNKGETSGTGVGFTRNPATGEKEIFAEYLMNAQGEDVVAGIRTPQPISKLQEDMPEIYNQFIEIANKLETHHKDMQDMEFTIEEGKLYFLQTRNGKRTAQAALKIAVDLEKEGLITKEEAVLKVEPKQLDTLLHPNFDSVELKKANVIAKGLPASPGAACGKVYFTAEDAKEAHENRGEKVILVRLETSPEDIEGMVASEGILTVRGGMTSHAAVVARGMGTCCVAGCGALKVNEEAKTFEAAGVTYHEGDYISIDGSTGNVYAGAIKTVEPEISGYFGILMGWADEIRALKVRANADTPRDTAQAIKFGAQGIGLCRTEHMFFDADRIMAVREMIVSKTEEQRRKALAKLLPMQREDFIGIYEELEERPATIRFLDPPLHEFLPTDHEDIEELAKDLEITYDELKSTIDSLHEFNPMMGHRGCRLAVSYPEIAEMQTRAVIEAAIDVKKRKGYNIVPEIMIPLVGEVKELKYIKDIVVSTADKVIKENGIDLKYLVGTMIEIPRAALTADEIAKEAEFFSFGTNDLTQMTFGFSRDDAGNFLNHYYDKKIYEFDPFQKLDQTGVGKLVEMAAKLGRNARQDLKLGICGEHGGDPSSVEFCHGVGLDYVSCSPFRVPVARLAAAQAQIKNPRK
ncbi:MAG: pyruvate, phosphate dikinase [Clostridium argentinense]|uniref:Pyruvate, phosphate dikinase n=1 Tax=Clostridium faecium TaxID=2762223 RepID=A0ABR8YX80_9CLOT|nr:MULTISPECIES: pyruvate, phosphate dikinase [Clostridium]MBD8048835.1 pyruvate, phosphate dikinase [Clostridium faecium]MBS5823959.1 pyruvate, phosphate dikinase [Clostridium argentinense]MDU1348320.1 pyruvate, phosphate dikinase [Clostridium argentinense]